MLFFTCIQKIETGMLSQPRLKKGELTNIVFNDNFQSIVFTSVFEDIVGFFNF